MVNMVCAEEMLQGPGSFCCCSFDIVDFDGRKVDGLRGEVASGEIFVKALHDRFPRDHRRRHDCDGVSHVEWKL